MRPNTVKSLMKRSRVISCSRVIRRSRVRPLAASLLGLLISGCSLVSLKSPEHPMSTRDLNARILTREYSTHFIATVAESADDIAAHEPDPNVMINALRWKIAVATQSERAATRMAPMMSLLDTWILSAQMKQFLSPGNPGQALFGSRQPDAAMVANGLDAEIETLAHRLIAPQDVARYQQFVDNFTREHPLTSLEFVRASVVELWSRQSGAEEKMVDSLGTIPEALADVSDRLQMYSQTLPSLNLWKTQLALQKSGISGLEVRLALKQLDERLARMSAAAESAPELVHGAVADVRRSLIDVLNRVDGSSAALIQSLGTERAALAADIRTEREALLVAADEQRQAIAQDLAKIADQVVVSSGQQARYLAREVLLLLVALAIVVLGLPFAAGYVVGKARSRRAA
jgi:hypothetical protein